MQHSASQYETPANPISHSIRRSLNLENLSLLDKAVDEENHHYTAPQIINPAKISAPKHSNFSEQDVSSNNIEQSKLALLKSKHNVTTTADDVTSPTSTVSSCRTSNGPLGQNTYNSADSSGYNTSSTLDVAEHPELLKNSLAANLSKYGLKQQSHILQTHFHAQKLNSSSRNRNQVAHVSHFTRSGKQTIADPIAESKTELLPEQGDHSCKQPPVNVTSNRPDSSVPIPAPRALYPSSHTPSPVSTRAPETDSPWQQRTHLSPQHCHDSKSQQIVSPNKFPSPITSSVPANASLVKNERLFTSEGRSRNPINAFDILPTDQVILHEKILKEGEF